LEGSNLLLEGGNLEPKKALPVITVAAMRSVIAAYPPIESAVCPVILERDNGGSLCIN
jgi:hypothetical protein